MIPIIKYNDKLLDRLSIFMKIGGITLWPWIILREKYRDNPLYVRVNKETINHESIHIKQQQELLVVGFYLWYSIEFCIRVMGFWVRGKLAKTHEAYNNICFEREAYDNAEDLRYLVDRKWYSFVKYIFG